MATLQFNGNELDGIHKLEDGVRLTLRHHRTAEIPAEKIQELYDVGGTLMDMCDALAAATETTYQVVSGTVIFRQVVPAQS